MREYRRRGGGKTAPSDKANSRAIGLAVKWVREHHPEVWVDCLAMARLSLGLPIDVGPNGQFTKPIEHGTNAGYHAHWYRGEAPCKACRDARNAKERERYAARRRPAQ
jgi:hypothetical protein